MIIPTIIIYDSQETNEFIDIQFVFFFVIIHYCYYFYTLLVEPDIAKLAIIILVVP